MFLSKIHLAKKEMGCWQSGWKCREESPQKPGGAALKHSQQLYIVLCSKWFHDKTSGVVTGKAGKKKTATLKGLFIFFIDYSFCFELCRRTISPNWNWIDEWFDSSTTAYLVALKASIIQLLVHVALLLSALLSASNICLRKKMMYPCTL